mmetsp:Transcript_18816/g.44710  ORF Transcript_18816/g.44710 Transcript_18816/m.44710 type:complete len:244 (+) Transcript_18816:609-1340(+)
MSAGPSDPAAPCVTPCRRASEALRRRGGTSEDSRLRTVVGLHLLAPRSCCCDLPRRDVDLEAEVRTSSGKQWSGGTPSSGHCASSATRGESGDSTSTSTMESSRMEPAGTAPLLAPASVVCQTSSSRASTKKYARLGSGVTRRSCGGLPRPPRRGGLPVAVPAAVPVAMPRHSARSSQGASSSVAVVDSAIRSWRRRRGARRKHCTRCKMERGFSGARLPSVAHSQPQQKEPLRVRREVEVSA